MNIIKKINERLKEEYKDNGIYAVFMASYFRYKNKYCNDEYRFLIGFIWGLSATGFISDQERNDAIDYLIHIDKKEGEQNAIYTK